MFTWEHAKISLTDRSILIGYSVDLLSFHRQSLSTYLCGNFFLMKKWFLVALVIIIAVIIVFRVGRKKDDTPERTKPEAIQVNSTPFNQALSNTVAHYTAMAEAFVNWDSTSVNDHASALLVSLDSLKLSDLGTDSAVIKTARSYIDITRTETSSIISETDWKEKRGSLNVLSQNFYDLLRAVQYSNQKIYYQECPMAFGEDTYGYWVSTTKPIRNPYLGTSDPAWGNKMLKCGSTKDSLKFFNNNTN